MAEIRSGQRSIEKTSGEKMASFMTRCTACGTITQTTSPDWKAGTMRPKCCRCGCTIQTCGPKIRPRRKCTPPTRNGQSQRPLKPCVRKARADIDSTVAEAAEKSGLQVRVKMVDNSRGRRGTAHVMFRNASGRIILEWWPGTGAARQPGSNRKMSAEDADEALHLAEWIVADQQAVSADC